MESLFKSQRLNFRKIELEDFGLLKEIFQDIDTMYAWEHAFSDDEICEWICKNIHKYSQDGFSYFAVIDKENGNFIGVAGPLIENIDGNKYVGIAYIINKKYWHKGYGFESASASLDYAFNVLKADKVIAEIRPNNLSSRKIAEQLNMTIEFEFDKEYNGKIMPHLVYSIKNENNE